MNDQNRPKQQQQLLRSSIDELRLIGVMLRSFSKSPNAQTLSCSTTTSSPKSNNNNNNTAALGTILDQRYSSQPPSGTNHHQEASMSSVSFSSMMKNNNETTMTNNNKETSDLLAIDAGEVFSGVTTPRALNTTLTGNNQNHSQNQQNQQNQQNLLNIMAGPSSTSRAGSEDPNQLHQQQNTSPKTTTTATGGSTFLNFKSFFPTQEEQQQQNEEQSNPQLLALADRVDGVLAKLKQVLSSSSTSTSNEQQQQQLLLSSSTNEHPGNNNTTTISSSAVLPSSVAANPTENGNSNTNVIQPSNATKQQQQQDHRKHFPRSSPGWTRRVEPSVIDRYAKEQQQQQQNNTNNLKKPTPPMGGAPLTARPPLITAPQSITLHHNNQQQQMHQQTAPLNHTQTLLNNAPTTEIRNAMELQELTQATSASIYMSLRACAVQLRAESASVFIYFGGEMICCACVGAGSVFPPCSMRFASGGSLAHAVLTSGVALHRTVRQDVQLNQRRGSTNDRVDVRGRRRSLMGNEHNNNNNSNKKNSSSSSQFHSANNNNNKSSSSSSGYPVQDTLMMPVLGAFGGIESLNDNEADNMRKTKQNHASSEQQNNNNNNNITSGRRKSAVMFDENHSARGNQETQTQKQQQNNNNNNNLVAKPTCRAVLQLQNKNRGTAAFTQVDETKASYFADLIGYLMHLGDTANLDFRTTAYDPVGVQRSVPFIPAPALPGLSHPGNNFFSSTSDDSSSNFFLSSPSGEEGGYAFGKQNQNEKKNAITRYFEDFEPRRYIHRSDVDSSRQGAEAGSGVARRALLGQAANEVGPAPSLREIDNYVSNLRDCWSKAVDETVAASLEATTRAQQIRDLKTALEKSRGEATKLSELLQLERFSAGDYVSHYDALRSELENFLDKRTSGSEELFSWTSQNLMGSKNDNINSKEKASD